MVQELKKPAKKAVDLSELPLHRQEQYMKGQEIEKVRKLLKFGAIDFNEIHAH
jgi:hypothetical protein